MKRPPATREELMSAAEHPAGRSFLSIVTRGGWQLGMRASEGTRQPPGWQWGWAQGWDRPAEDRGRWRQPQGVMPGQAVRGAIRRARGGRWRRWRGRLQRYLGFREAVLGRLPRRPQERSRLQGHERAGAGRLRRTRLSRGVSVWCLPSHPLVQSTGSHTVSGLPPSLPPSLPLCLPFIVC